jgi:uncharacterized protein
MMEARTYPEGVPCWVDCEATDLEAACRFYGELFGWAFADAVPAGAPGSYLIAALSGRDAAAIAPADSEVAAWRMYVAVGDADAIAARVTAYGGTVLAEPRDVGPGGRGATCADPSGARFGLWQPRRRLGAQVVNEPGAWNLSDLRGADRDEALAFYGAVFGWEADEMDGGPALWRRPGYADHLAATIDPDIHARHEAIGAPPGFQDAVAWLAPADGSRPARWQTTFAVADRDAAAALAERLGAEVLASKDTEWTRTAEIRDSQGAELTLSQFTPPS